MTRSRLIQLWFAVVAVVVAIMFVSGVRSQVDTAVMFMTLSLVPPIMVMMLWPGIQPPTVAEVLRQDDRPR